MEAQLSQEIRTVLEYAKEEAMRLGSYTITPDHLFLGILRNDEDDVVSYLKEHKVNIAALKKKLDRNIIISSESVPLEDAGKLSFTGESEAILKGMYSEAHKFSIMKPGIFHLFLSILSAGNSLSEHFLEGKGITYENVFNEITNHGLFFGNSDTIIKNNTPDVLKRHEDPVAEDDDDENSYEDDEDVDLYVEGENNITDDDTSDELEIDPVSEGAQNDSDANSIDDSIFRSMGLNPHDVPREKQQTTLEKYAYDITDAASKGELDPVIGRDGEIEHVEQILGRRRKNNPLLIGEPGVGKSAIVDGLALRIAQGKVSRWLSGKRILSINLGSLVAGTQFRGQFEERIRKILKETKENGNIILFIDEIHTLIGAGGAPGTLDAAEMLKPAMAKGELQCIGATTINEYRNSIEKDGALNRRFQKVLVEPTNYEETLKILDQIKYMYEMHHRVKYTEDALKLCISLSTRYINDRFLPDKAIDIMDEAGSMVHNTRCKAPRSIIKMEEAIGLLKIKKLDAAKKYKLNEAIIFRDLERTKKKELEAAYDKWEIKQDRKPLVVNGEDIATVVSNTVHIPVNKIAESEENKLRNMASTLKKRIIGQDTAVDAITKAILRSRAGLKDPDRPIGSFLLLGPTGVGKTQLAKVLAEYMFDSEDSLIRLDMSEYMENASVSKLIGAPPGYIGYDEGGQLSEMVKRKPYSVVLLDEIEKAHPDVFNILLQILDEGRLTESTGRKIDFRNTILILTSNTGSVELKEFSKSIGYGSPTKEHTSLRQKDIIKKALNETFRPEFLNRLDEKILFNSLTREDIRKIINIELSGLFERVRQAGYELHITAGARDFIARKGYDSVYGARPLKRAIQHYAEDPIAEAIVCGTINIGDTIVLGINSGKNNTEIKQKNRKPVKVSQNG
ncbi:MAG: ATP-dependent Clp protease ATP-binding subunit [Bacteroidales bacterium]|jgi:ATP-dependent Clp protease ATP-binding subunit ClpC|nr:ATP-dependent Clp protease ATP-binding subunit [Bacteroidales bacterium]